MKDLSDRARLWRRAWRRRARAAERRGVLMLVVLSMLVLFLLIGTTFLLTSSQYRTASRIVEKANRTTFQPEDVLERALMQVLRDTNNRNSSVRYHSLLRDYYGTDGFVASVYPAANANGVAITAPDATLLPRYAGATAADVLGPTEGQLVDLFVSDDDSGNFNDGDVIGLDINDDGLPVGHGLARTDGYYSGCLLTMLDGPCRGVSVRVVEYDYLGENNNVPFGRFRVMAPRRADGQALRFGFGNETLTDFVEGSATAITGRRFMVNGRPLNGTGVGFDAFASPSVSRLTAMEAFSFTPPGDNDNNYGNEIALMPNSVFFDRDRVAHLRAQGGSSGYDEGILLENFLYLNNATGPGSIARDTPLYDTYPGPGGADESYDAPDFQNLFLASQSPRPRVRGRVVRAQGGGTQPDGQPSVDPDVHYASGNAPAPFRLDLEDVPIPSFHRPALANFWFHRLHRTEWLTGLISDPSDRARAILRPFDENGNPLFGLDAQSATQIAAVKRKFSLRPLHDDHPGFNGSNPLSIYDSRVTALGAALTGANLVNAATGEITFPFWEAVGPWDVDNDRDGAPDSVWVDLGLPIQKTEDGRLYKPLVAFLIEDLDGRLNLNAHGSTEHFVTDPLDFSRRVNLTTGQPVGGFRANLAQDYDNNPALGSSDQLPHGAGWGPADITLRPILSPDIPLSVFQSILPNVTGDAQYDDYARLLVGRSDPRNPWNGSPPRAVSPAVNVAVPFGRYGALDASENLTANPNAIQYYRPGRTFVNTAPLAAATREERVPFDFAGYPEFTTQDLSRSGFGRRPDLMSRYADGLGPTGASVNEPVVDGWIDFTVGRVRPTLDDNPYELDLSADARRRSAEDLGAIVNSYTTANPLNDDAAFSPAELERLLRAFDADADKLPDRLWNLVDAFDPDKLAVQDAIARGAINPDNFAAYRPDAIEAVRAQAQAAIHRRQVTTESFDPPVPNENWTARLILGADGLPGVPVANIGISPTPNPNDDNDLLPTGPVVNEGDEAVVGYNVNEVHVYNPGQQGELSVPYAELWANGCDDYTIVMLSDPPPNARITDFFRYRITLQLARDGIITLYPAAGETRTDATVIDQLVNQILFGDNALPTTEVRNNSVAVPLENPGQLPADLYSFGGLLAPETLAGLKMDLNRPFGDGRDNNGNGVVDEPQEAGEPYVDLNGNTTWDAGEPYLDLDNDGRFYADFNGDGVLDNNDWRDFDGDGSFEPVVDSLWPQTPGGPFPFDYTRGADANGRGAFVETNGQPGFQPGEPRVYDDSRMARQLYVRHLYCLMLALMDDGYLAPIDETDPQVRHYLDPRSGSLIRDPAFPPSAPGVPRDGSSAAYRIAYDLGRIEGTAAVDPSTFSTPREVLLLAEARRQAMRKLTVRQVAQWAINCVDIRDPDAIQTPFEYDENPWDGWNVVISTVADTATGQLSQAIDPNTGQPARFVFPLDGDLATDENDSSIRRIVGGVDGWARDVGDGVIPLDSDGDNDTAEQVIRVAPRGRRFVLSEQTRGVVWGAERPELLMTEGLALHDRRLVDEAVVNVEGRNRPSGVGATEPLDLGEMAGGDDDPDQLLRPRGSAFVELYNPWSADDQKPRELYSRQLTFLTRPGPNTPFSLDPNVDVPIPPNEIRPNIPYRTATTAPYESVEGIALDRLSNAAAVRRDPSRAAEPITPANPNGKRMRIDRDGFRVPPGPTPPGVVGAGGDLLPPAASPVWRVICVEEHPDVRNAITENSTTAEDDNPYARPTSSDGPWMYSAGPGDAVPTAAANFPVLPLAYAQVAELQEFNSGAPLPPSITAPLPRGTVFRQADPDWPEFDRFARPEELGVASLNVQQINIDVADITPTASTNVPVQVDRLRLMKPDRHIERAWYFIGAPEIDPLPTTAPPTVTNPIRPTTYQIPSRRNLVQPGLLLPDLSYRYDTTVSANVDTRRLQNQLVVDYEFTTPGGATPSLAPPSVSTPSGLEFVKVNAAATINEGLVVHGNRFVATDRFDADRSVPVSEIPSGGSDVDGNGFGIDPGDTIPADIPEIAESLPIAPILPGRYAVLGPSSNAFEITTQSNDLSGLHGRDINDYIDDATTIENRHATVLSHRFYSSGENPSWNRFRRIELIPSSNPDRHQVVTRFNGWASPLRSSEVVPTDPTFALADYTARPLDLARLTNVTELPDPRPYEFGGVSEFTLDGDRRLIQPVVAVPMDGFNVSEPLDGYHLRRNEIYQALPTPGDPVQVRVAPSVENPDGQTLGTTDQLAPATLTGFDQPLDVLGELGAVRSAGGAFEERDQTTPAYRTLHLQRLANPLLAWNPAPLRPGGQAVAEHDPSRPVNPYLTVDSLPMDLIAYNGAENPATRRPAATAKPLATNERGVTPGLTPINDPNAATLAAATIPPALRPAPTYATIATAELTPRDLWRAVTGLVINNDPDAKLGPIATNHPDSDVFAASSGGPPGVGGGAVGVIESPYDSVLQHSLGFANRGFGDLITNNDLGGAVVAQVDLNGDSNLDRNNTADPTDDEVRLSELTGAPAIDQSDDNLSPNDLNGNLIPEIQETLANNDTPPALHWPNRPFTSAGELTLVPMWSSSRLLTHYSTFNAYAADQRNPYDGDLVLDDADPPNRLSAANLAAADPRVTNRFRWRNERAPFGHLLPFFATATGPARAIPWSAAPGSNDVDVIAYGAPHYYRILDYVHTPSRFIETDTLLNPEVFGQLPPTLDDPRIGLSAPFNRVDNYREPGRVNLNTVGGRRDTQETPSSGPRADRPADLWSEVYDGLMHRREDVGAIDYPGNQLLQAGHLGPAWRDVVLSRRGYIQPTFVDGPTSGVDYSPGILHPSFPTLFANPLRAPEGGFNVPVGVLQHGGVDATMLRAHAFSPGEDGAWGTRGRGRAVVDKGGDGNPDPNLIRDDSDEAGVILDPAVDQNVDAFGNPAPDGRPDRDIPSVRLTSPIGPVYQGTIPDSLAMVFNPTTGFFDRTLPVTAAPTPMFSGASTEPALNTERNPQLRYGPISRLTNLTTGRSGVFAVWITVGYFEVTPANQNQAIWSRYMVDNNGDGIGDDFRTPELEALFFRVYHDGMTIGQEIDLDTGENRRMRGFYLIDRTLPVAFKPGDDVNVEDAILLRRRIE